MDDISTLLLCVPHAGAGPAVFKKWSGYDVRGIEPHPVLLSGREQKLFDEPHTDIHAAVAETSQELRPLIGDRPVALFGHCLGALVCFELTRSLRSAGVAVTQLIVSGSRAPDQRRERLLTGIVDDERFLAELERNVGYRAPAMDDPELRELLMPTLRADVRMDEEYRLDDKTPLDIPITAVRGAEDEIVSARDINAWRSWTTADFTTVEFPGGHMYVGDHGAALVRLAAGPLAVTGPADLT